MRRVLVGLLLLVVLLVAGWYTGRYRTQFEVFDSPVPASGEGGQHP